jgi:hypothetical protein
MPGGVEIEAKLWQHEDAKRQESSYYTPGILVRPVASEIGEGESLSVLRLAGQLKSHHRARDVLSNQLGGL